MFASRTARHCNVFTSLLVYVFIKLCLVSLFNVLVCMCVCPCVCARAYVLERVHVCVSPSLWNNPTIPKCNYSPSATATPPSSRESKINTTQYHVQHTHRALRHTPLPRPFFKRNSQRKYNWQSLDIQLLSVLPLPEQTLITYFTCLRLFFPPKQKVAQFVKSCGLTLAGRTAALKKNITSYLVCG